jgi:hypothetical protein
MFIGGRLKRKQIFQSKESIRVAKQKWQSTMGQRASAARPPNIESPYTPKKIAVNITTWANIWAIIADSRPFFQ